MKLYAVLPSILQIATWPLFHILLYLKGSFTITGMEHLKKIKGPVIFAPNHVNDIDPVLTRAMLPIISKHTPLFWVGRFRKDYDTYSEDRFEGWRGVLYSDLFFRIWGSYPALKGTGDYEKSLRNHLRIINDGFSVCIFPQGGKAKYLGEKAPARGGVAFLSHRTGVPIIPVSIAGTIGTNAKKLFLGKPTFTVTLSEPVYITGENPDYKAEAEKIVKTIYSKLSDKEKVGITFTPV